MTFCRSMRGELDVWSYLSGPMAYFLLLYAASHAAFHSPAFYWRWRTPLVTAQRLALIAVEVRCEVEEKCLVLPSILHVHPTCLCPVSFGQIAFMQR